VERGAMLGVLALAGLGGRAIGASAKSVASAAVNDFTGMPTARKPTFHSRPDLRIPGLAVDLDKGTTADGLIFLAPYGAKNGQEGAVIVDGSGSPIWEQPLNGLETDNFRVQTYQGQPALTWWEGKIESGHGVGSYVIANNAYKPIKRVYAGNGLQGDLHEFLLTSRGTALFTAYKIVNADLRSVGGPRHGSIQDAIFQEVDVASGRVLLEWHSLDHIALSESYWPVGSGQRWDYVHLNSVDVDAADENSLFVSSRNTHTIYKVDRSTGEVVWRLGGKRTDFALGTGAVFAWQHDVRSHPGGVVTVFDNEGAPFVGDTQTRALVLAVDEQAMTASLQSEYLHPVALQAASKGNVQLLPNGNFFVGWGAEPFVSEFSPSGELLFDARLGADYVGYRAFRIPWSATGEGSPSVVAKRDGAGGTEVWVSWNGDTQVANWLVLGAGGSGALKSLGTFARSGFETTIRISSSPSRLAVRGLDPTGHTLGQSATLTV
jgi:hypothetical protein